VNRVGMTCSGAKNPEDAKARYLPDESKTSPHPQTRRSGSEKGRMAMLIRSAIVVTLLFPASLAGAQSFSEKDRQTAGTWYTQH
jgi:hypothetical protein